MCNTDPFLNPESVTPLECDIITGAFAAALTWAILSLLLHNNGHGQVNWDANIPQPLGLKLKIVFSFCPHVCSLYVIVAIDKLALDLACTATYIIYS